MGKSSSLAKNTALLSVGAILSKGLSFVMVPFFSSWISSADYGTFDLLLTYVSLLLPVIGLASNDALFRFSMDAETKEEKVKLVSNCFSIFTINSLIFLVIAVYLQFCAGWDLGLCFFVLAIGEVYNLHLRGYLRAIKRLEVYSFVSAVTTVFIAVFTTIFVKACNLGLKGMLFGYGIGYICGDIAIVVFTKYWTYLSLSKVSFSGMKEQISYSFPLIPNNISWWFINVSDRTIINAFLGAAQNGVYAIAYKIPNILSAVFSVFSVSWQQSATEALTDVDRDKFYNDVYNKTAMVLLSLCCGVLSLNSWLFNYIFDVKYYDGYLYAPILIGGTVFATMSQFYGSIQISFKQSKANGSTTVVGAICNLVIHLVLVKVMGLYAAAISTVLSQAIVCVLRNFRLRRTVRLRFELKTYILMGIYLYFTIAAYHIEIMTLNIVNVMLATLLVLVTNKEYVIKAGKKIIRKATK